jgi:hypothetical protein
MMMRRRGPQKDQAKRFDWKKARRYQTPDAEAVEIVHPCRVIMRDGIALEPIPQLAQPPKELTRSERFIDRILRGDSGLYGQR